jgi:hypothetical protein
MINDEPILNQIAVKKLNATNNSKAEMEFAVEVLGRVRHKNLLALRGYCAGADQRVIVYDYMPNLSLFSHLHGHFAGDVRLDWKRRTTRSPPTSSTATSRPATCCWTPTSRRSSSTSGSPSWSRTGSRT